MNEDGSEGQILGLTCHSIVSVVVLVPVSLNVKSVYKKKATKDQVYEHARWTRSRQSEAIG